MLKTCLLKSVQVTELTLCCLAMGIRMSFIVYKFTISYFTFCSVVRCIIISITTISTTTTTTTSKAATSTIAIVINVLSCVHPTKV